MKWVRFDSVGGASGDMILGALIGLGADRSEIQRRLETIGMGPFHLEVIPFASHGIHGVQARVRVDDHDDHHDHHHHPHHHDHDHRGLKEIVHLIRHGDLPEPVKTRSIEVFTRLGEAEARIHGTTPDRIHFHEVGAVDSIADIVGSCLALHGLGADSVSVGPLPIGHGVITCAHGVYPNPAPATADLLKGARVLAVDEPFELVTPTGAALLTTWPRKPDAEGRVVATANSFGHRTLNGRPNLLRAMLMEEGDPARSDRDCLVLECNLDDSNPEWIGILTERLLAAGALDVFCTAIQMKKQRPGTLLSVLCEPSRRDAMLDLIFRESTTFGVREHVTRREILDRRWESVETPFGPVRVKIGSRGGRDLSSAPEMEDCAKLSAAHGVSARAVYEAAMDAFRKRSNRAS